MRRSAGSTHGGDSDTDASQLQGCRGGGRVQMDCHLTRREWTQVIGATHHTLQSDVRATQDYSEKKAW